MEWTRTGIFITLLVVVCACTQKNKTVTDAEPDRPEAFANDDELLDYIQKTHFNYMWEGAEKTSGLACERIHLDNVYPQQDQDVIRLEVADLELPACWWLSNETLSTGKKV